MRLLLTPLVLLVLLSGCSMTPAPGRITPATGLYATEGSYAAVLALAVAYRDLPVCRAAGQIACHDPAVVLRIRAANIKAYAVMRGAETLLAAHGSPGAVAAAVTAADAAVADFAVTVPRG